MADGSIHIDTKIDQSGIKTGLASMGKIVASGIGAAVAAVGALGVHAVKTGMEFDTAMSQVAATMGTTTDQITDLTELAKKMGSTTKFTATEAAEGLNYLALAGYDAEQQTAALPTVLNLASAGAMDLGYASDLVTDSMAALGLEMGDLENYSDQMAKTASRSNTSVAQLGEAILVCGGQAKLAQMSTAEMNTALGILADNGIKGSEGGTALRNTLKNLYTPTDKAAGALKALGVETADANGKLRPMQDVLLDLNGALGNLTEEERINAMSEIFDTRTIAAANALLSNSGDRWNELSAEIEDCAGACEQMAAVQLDNLEGDITILQSAFSGLEIEISDALNGTLREGVQFATEQIGVLQESFNSDGFEGLASGIGEVLSNVVTKITEYLPKLISMGSSLIISLIDGCFKSSSSLADVAVQAGTELIAGFMGISNKLIVLGIRLISDFASSLASKTPDVLKTFTDGIGNFAEICMDCIPDLIFAGTELLQSLAKGISDSLPELIDKFVGCISVMIIHIATALPEFIKAGCDVIAALLNGVISAIPSIMAVLPDIVQSIIDTIVLALPILINAASQMIMSIANALPSLFISIIGVLPTLVQGIVDGLTLLIPQIIECGINLLTALIRALPEIINTIVLALPSIVNGIIGALLDLLPLIVDCGVQLLVSLVQALPDIIYAIVAVLPVIIASIISTLVGLIPLLIQCGIDLLVSLVKAIPEIIISIVAVMPQIINAIIQALIDSIPLLIQCGIDLLVSLIGALPDIIVSLVSAMPKIINGIITALLNNIPLIIQSGIKLFTSLITAIPDIIRTLLGAIPKIISAIVNAFINAKNKFVEVGKNLFFGVKDGIVNSVSTVINSVKESCGKVLDSVKKFFGIHSPSRVFKEVIGENLMFGLAEGIDSEAKSAISSMTDVAKEIADTEFDIDTSELFDNADIDADSIVKRLKYEVDDSNDFALKTVSAKTVTAGVLDNQKTNGSKDDSNTPKYIENNIYIDGKKTARTITPYVAKELNWESK